MIYGTTQSGIQPLPFQGWGENRMLIHHNLHRRPIRIVRTGTWPIDELLPTHFDFVGRKMAPVSGCGTGDGHCVTVPGGPPGNAGLVCHLSCGNEKEGHYM